MNRFYISQVIASGDKVVESSIEFEKGMNLIVGPSNTGKSHVMKLIDCVLGGKETPFNMSETGYDTMTVCLKNDDGESVRLTRKIILNKDKTDEVPASDVMVESTAANIESETYFVTEKAPEYGALLLRLLGIDKPCQVIGSEDFKPQRLTFRSIWHFFFLEEENIFRSKTVLDNPEFGRINLSLASLLFLLTGDDLHDMIPKMSKEEIEARQIHRAGVIFYLTDKLTELKKRREAIQKAYDEAENVDLGETIDSIFTELDSIESEIQEKSDLCKDLMAKIYSLSSRLEEARFLQERYAALQSQYQSDIRRLEFIVDGKLHGHGNHYLATCPFCNHEIDDKSEDSQAILAASAAEASRLTIQIADLDEVKRSTDADVRDMEEEMGQLNGKYTAATKQIEQVLRPRADKLKNNLEKYKQAQELQTQLHALDWMAQQLDTDIQGKQQEKDPTIEKFSARDAFDKSVWQGYSDTFADMFSQCGYPNNPPVHLDLNMSTDAVIAGKKKKGLGKGYRAFVNTIVLFSLMKYMEKINCYAPHLLILDSPILSLKEKKHQISEKERATAGMRESLFRYMIENCGDNQVIIAENEIPENVDYSTVKIIEFTQDETLGRYGFLMSERN